MGEMEVGKMHLIVALPNLNYRFSAVPVRISGSCCVHINKLNLKFVWRVKRQNSIKKEEKNLCSDKRNSGSKNTA